MLEKILDCCSLLKNKIQEESERLLYGSITINSISKEFSTKRT